MKRVRRRKQNNSIELTSLLDVIFIVLMVVFLGYFLKGEAMGDLNEREYAFDQRVAEWEDTMAESEAAMEERKAQYDTYDYVLEETACISITAKYVPSDPKNRTLIVATNHGRKEIPVDAGNSRKSFDEFRAYLSSIVTEAGADNKPVFLNYSDEQTLYRDDQEIQEILRDLEKDYQLIYRCNTAAGEGENNG